MLNLKGLSRKTKIAVVGGIGAVLLLAQVTNVDWPTQVKNRPHLLGSGNTSIFSDSVIAPAYSVSTRGDRWITLQNPDFEGSSVIPPPGWATFQTPTLSYETVSPAPNKTQSLKVVTAAGPGAGVVSSTTFSIQNGGQGEQYIVSGWVKSDGVVTCALELDYRNKNGVVLDTLQASSSSSSWTFVSAQGFTTNGSISANYYNYQVTNSAGTCWFDKNSVVKALIPGEMSALAFSRITHADRASLVENPDFENIYSPAGQPVVYQEIPPAGWGFNNLPHGTITYDTSTPYTGKTRSIKIVSDGVTVNQGIYQHTLFSALPGETYAFSAALKSDGTANAQAQINWYDKSFNFLGGCFLNRTANTWTILTANCTVPASATQGQVILNNPGMSGTIEFDMVNVQKMTLPGSNLIINSGASLTNSIAQLSLLAPISASSNLATNALMSSGGFSTHYDGTLIGTNIQGTNGLQSNALAQSWAVDVGGGFDNFNYLQDAFTVKRQAVGGGGVWSNLLTLSNVGNLMIPGVTITSPGQLAVNTATTAIVLGDSTLLPATVGTQLWIVGGFGGQASARLFFGDGTNTHQLFLSTRTGSVTTDQFTFFDNGSLLMKGGVKGITVSSSASSTFDTVNFISSETGANNAIAGTLNDAFGAAVPLTTGLCVTVELAHSLAANNANTFNYNGTGAAGIFSHAGIGSNFPGTGWQAGTPWNACFDGTHWLETANVATMVASGASHIPGVVPDPGSSAGTARFLREDATWSAPITTVLKKGSGGGAYLSTSTTYAVIDSTNLCNTVTIPTGWKLSVQVSGSATTNTAIVNGSLALTDNAACSTANSGILQEVLITPAVAGNPEVFSLSYVINGDGASHNVALQFKTSNAADSVGVFNNSSTFLPTMVFLLLPSS
jgi:hypothetical protein